MDAQGPAQNALSNVADNASPPEGKKSSNILIFLVILIFGGGLLYLLMKSKKTDHAIARLDRGRQQNLSETDVVELMRDFFIHPQNRAFLKQSLQPLMPEPDPVYVPLNRDEEEEDENEEAHVEIEEEVTSPPKSSPPKPKKTTKPPSSS